ncbi:MAG TPA: ATP-binding protein [Pyrinomonadaceae bacterium]|jgi:two-component system sensor histidine kinase PilS (NtrC family)
MKFNEKFFSNENNLTQKIQTLIIGRLLVIFLLLVASWIYNSGGNLRLSLDNFPQYLFLIFLISVGLTIVYFFVLRLSKSYAWQIRVQFMLDALLITWLVWRTGDLTSPYIMLYIVSISISSIFLSARETLLMSSFCVFLFTILSVAVASGLLRSLGVTPEPSKTIQIIGFNDVAFFVVGLLASRLSDRHASGEKLRETTKTLANLRVLHERIVESIRSGLITTDLEGNIYTFNATASEITGHSAEEMRGKSVYSLFGDIKLPIKDALDATESGDQPPRFETDVITPEGFAVRVGYGVSPLYAESGETTGLIITFQDLTEIRSIEESGRRKDRLAAVGRVAAGLAHEIRNPLGAMRGAIQVLQSQTPPESSQAALMEIILRESDRLNKIITNFLTYARPRVSNFSEIDVREAINDTFTLLKHSPDVAENHTLEAVLPENPMMISADPTQLKQIFWNLARNSIQAMTDGGTLRVTLEKIGGERIRILFADTGRGMPPEQVEQLFEPFSTSTTGGTGLGLSIVYQIIRDHSGSINVRSREGDGTTITIELPTEFRSQGAPDENGKEESATRSSRLEDFLTVKK